MQEVYSKILDVNRSRTIPQSNYLAYKASQNPQVQLAQNPDEINGRKPGKQPEWNRQMVKLSLEANKIKNKNTANVPC